MQKSVLLLFLISFSFSICQQKHNLNFEQLDGESATGWTSFGDGNYEIIFDAENPFKDKISGSVKSISETLGYRALSYSIPVTFAGKKVKLSGYLKTENVSDGWAGLWLRIDPDIGFDNMRNRGVKGSTDWKKYEVELALNNRANTLVFGGLLVGKGQIWIDDLEITVDGKALELAPLKSPDKVSMDTEFDSGSGIVFDPSYKTSEVTFNKLNEKTKINLELLGRLWGFLKYHHPQIAKGNLNWDYELFRIMPDYLNSKTNTERDNLLLDWINSLGEVPICKSCNKTKEEAFLKPDLAWIRSSNSSSKLKEKLEFIYENRHQGEHYYIDMAPRVGNPVFKNENSYSSMPYPDAGFRLLALYRYWNMIQYYFPYRHLTDKDWNDILGEYIPLFINAKSELEYELAAVKLIAEVNDSHANLWGGNNKIQEERGSNYAPVHVRFIEDALVVDGLFEDEKSLNSGLKIGDIITHIDGKKVESIIEDLSPYYPASNVPTRLRDISIDILRSKTKVKTLKINRDGRSFEKKLELCEIDDIKGHYKWHKPKKDNSSFKKINDDIGYITLKTINPEDIEVLRREFEGTKGIIVDIRNYPSTPVVFSLGNYLNSNRTEFVKFTGGNINNPGEFTFRDGHKVGLKRGWSYKGQKVVVLVNEASQSQAEYTAMAFRAGDKTTVIGSTTAGADGNVSRINLPGGLNTMISGIGIYYPDGSETQRVGIVPDIEVKPTIEGIKNGQDEVLDKAIELINTSISNTSKIKD